MTIDYEALSDKELAEQFLRMELNMVAQVSGNLPPERAAHVIRSLEEETTEEAAQRICAFFLGLQTKEQVAEVGKVMNTRYTLKLIEEAVKLDHSHLWKISALLIGLTHRVFLKVLESASSKEMEVIQHEALKEPLQHHLTVFVHEAARELEDKTRELAAVTQKVEQTPPEEISYEDIAAWIKQINWISDSFDPLVMRMNRALSVAWNTNRPDLIDRLNQILDAVGRTKRLMIGTPRTEKTLPTGFFATLEKNLCRIYGDEGDPESPLDTEPAVEALAKLSLWYLKDYWEAGLLPDIEDESKLGLDPETHSDKECREYREALMDEVNKNLEALGLATVGDFKAAFIGTKEVLMETIARRQIK